MKSPTLLAPTCSLAVLHNGSSVTLISIVDRPGGTAPATVHLPLDLILCSTAPTSPVPYSMYYRNPAFRNQNIAREVFRPPGYPITQG